MPVTNRMNCQKCGKLIYINKTETCSACRMTSCADCGRRFRKDAITPVDRCYPCRNSRNKKGANEIHVA